MNKEYKLTVGLEVHAELSTKTKMFCDSPNDTLESRPNTNICPICLGYPGTLPVINHEAVHSILRLGTAVGGEIAEFTEFDRKNYFYPDIPKGYQISQYKHPLVKGGELAGIRLTRVHLEEDTARSSHDKSDEYSLLDFNRAGVPLMELVTEPVIHTALEASNFAKELQLLLKYLGISGANMEKGEMRVEANVSVSKDDQKGTKVEVKNINSFKAVEKAIKFEIERQIETLERGESVIQETRGWDENKEITFSQRLKESAHDYRYFPDPDLPKLFLSSVPEFSKEELKKTIPELPWQKREKYKSIFGLKDEHVEIYVRDREWGSLIEEVAQILKEPKLVQLASNYMTSDLKKVIAPEALVEVVTMVSEREVSSRGAKEILKIIEATGGEARKIAEENNLIQKSNVEDLKVVVEEIIRDNQKVVDEYKKGKTTSLEFLVGQAMKATKGSGNPEVLKDLFTKLI